MSAARERFMRFVSPEPTSGCWLWTGSGHGRGYGQFNPDGRPTTAHRAAWWLFVGPVPLRTMVCHRCDNRMCVNPAHLFLGSAQDNTDDMMAKGRHRSPVGSQSPIAKVSEADVARMRSLYGAGENCASIARTFGIHRVTALRICKRETWRHVQ